MTNVLRVGRSRALFWLAIGLAAGYVLSLMLAGGRANAQTTSFSTGLEEVRSDKVEVSFNSKTTVWIRVSGFVPGAEVTLLIRDGYGVLDDITVTADPRTDGGGSVYPLIANDDGAWATQWLLGRFTRAGVGAEGIYTLYVYDSSGEHLLATTPIALCNASRGAGVEVPSFCSA